jgi:hypothetical protein
VVECLLSIHRPWSSAQHYKNIFFFFIFFYCFYIYLHVYTLGLLSYKNFFKITQVPVAHTYKPSYLGNRDQDDHALKTAWPNSLQHPIIKIARAKCTGCVAQLVQHLPASMKSWVQNTSPTKKILKIMSYWGNININGHELDLIIHTHINTYIYIYHVYPINVYNYELTSRQIKIVLIIHL